MDTVRAILLMILAMVLLALSDMFVKLAAALMPIGQVMFLLSALGTLVFAIWARIRGDRLLVPALFNPTVIARNGLEIVAAFGMILGVAYNPITTFATIVQATPIIVTIGAALILGEHVGWRRWLAVCIGFVGILVVLRPGTDAFAPVSLFALMGATALALRDVITRLIPQNISALTLSAWGFGATIVPGLVMLLLSPTPPNADPTGVLAILGGVATTTTGYYALTTAMRLAPASIVAPFRYTRLIFVLMIGLIVFSEIPDGMTLLGAAIIIGSGLYTFLRERRLVRQS